MYEVVVPQGVRPGQPFALIANGQRVMVTCPQRAAPGQKIQFRLPIQLSSEEIQSIKLNYEKEGWSRCLTTELQFVWVRQDAKGATDSEGNAAAVGAKTGTLMDLKENIDKLAFVRRLSPNPSAAGNTDIDLAPAQEVLHLLI
jgi:hypothetical protein